jgi:ethanolamine permease
MWALGITIVIGGQYFAWNAALVAGFGSFIIATALIATGYLCLSLCIAELSSGLPFAGGSYGLARVTAGIFPGYLVACFDSVESVVYVATSTVSIGQMMTVVLNTSVSMEPLYWVIFYVSSMAINAYGGMFFWRINMGLALVSTFIVLLYIFGAAGFADFDENAKFQDEKGLDRWFVGGPYQFMKILHIPAWFFVGVESINLACQDTDQPKKLIPKGYVAAIGTLIVTCIGVLFVAVSLDPGIEDISEELTIFNNGFQKMFNIGDEAATLLSLPALYATAFGFMFCYGRQLRSMGNSGLLNTAIGKSIEGRNTPGRALLLGSVIGFIVCLIVYFVPYIGLQLYNICMLGAFNAYFAQFYSYYVFNTRLSTIKREFRSPLGLAGAAVGAAIFFLAMIGIIGFQDDNGFAIAVFMVYVIVVTVYYVQVVMARQYFSKEESEVLLIAHVMTSKFLALL